MAKKIYTEAKIELGGHDISEHVTGWSIGGKAGDLFRGTVDVRQTVLVIARGPYSTIVRVKETDISSWVEGYRYVDGGVRLYLRLDSEILTINGTHPWEYPSGV